MANLVLLGLCLLIGLAARRIPRFPPETAQALNGFIIHVSLPALVLLHIHNVALDVDLLYPALMPWIVFAFGCAFFILLGRRLGLERRTVGGLILCGALGNTSFVGLPMIEAFYGKEHLAVGLVVDQLGTFMCLSIPGILLAVRYSAGGAVSTKELAQRVLLFPPFQAIVLALLLRPLAYPGWVEIVLNRLGDTLTPLALVSVGFQLRFGELRRVAGRLSLGLFYKLVLAPLAILALYGLVLGARGPVFQVTVFEAAMAPMITGGIVAMEHDLDPPLVTMMLGVGIPVSFLTLVGWWQVLGAFG